MVVVIQFAAKFQIQFVSEMVDAFFDVFLLHMQVFVIVKSDFHNVFLPI